MNATVVIPTWFPVTPPNSVPRRIPPTFLNLDPQTPDLIWICAPTNFLQTKHTEAHFKYSSHRIRAVRRAEHAHGAENGKQHSATPLMYESRRRQISQDTIITLHDKCYIRKT